MRGRSERHRARLAARAGRPGLGLRLADGAGRRRGALAGGQAAQVVLRQQHRRRRRQLRAAAHLPAARTHPAGRLQRHFAHTRLPRPLPNTLAGAAEQGGRAERGTLASRGRHLERVDVGFCGRGRRARRGGQGRERARWRAHRRRARGRRGLRHRDVLRAVARDGRPAHEPARPDARQACRASTRDPMGRSAQPTDALGTARRAPFARWSPPRCVHQRPPLATDLARH